MWSLGFLRREMRRESLHTCDHSRPRPQARIKLLYVAGKDAQSRPIVVFSPAILPPHFFAREGGEDGKAAVGANAQRLLRYVFVQMEEITQRDYVMVYCHTKMNWLSSRCVCCRGAGSGSTRRPSSPSSASRPA